MSIGSRIKEQRNKINLTQQELAERIELSLNMIKRLETNRVKPSIETLDKLSTLFEVSTDYLLCKVSEQEELRRNAFNEYLKLSDDNKLLVDTIINKIMKGDS